MSKSRFTRIIAEGIHLYAELMDLPTYLTEGSPQQAAWNLWKDSHLPEWEKIVKIEQAALFDRLLNYD